MMSLSPSEHVEEADGGDGDAGAAAAEDALGCNSIDTYGGYKFWDNLSTREQVDTCLNTPNMVSNWFGSNKDFYRIALSIPG